MENSKLIALIKTFDSGKMRAFSDFVSSPYYNKRRDLVVYFEHLKKLAKKGFPKNSLVRERLFKAVCPDNDYEEKAFNHLSSQLLKLLEKFICQQKFEDDGVQAECYLLDYYLSHQLDKHFTFAHRSATSTLAGVPNSEKNKYHQMTQLADLADRHFASKKIRRFSESLQSASDNLDIYYLSKKLKYLCEMLDWQTGFTKNYEPRLLEEVKTHLKQTDYSRIPFIQIYSTLLFILSEEESRTANFQKFKTLLFANTEEFEHWDLKELYYFGINFCIVQFRIGNKESAVDLMDLYQTGIEKAVLLENGAISPWTFKNVVKLGLGLKRLDWTKQFIEQYGNLLPPEFQEDSISFNLAQVYYFQRDFENALICLNKAHFNDIYYNMDAKAMLARIYSETEEFEALDSLLSSFYIYLKRRSDIPKNAKLPYFNFIKILQVMQKGAGFFDRDSLRQKIATTKSLNAKSWLLSRLNS